MGRGSASYCAPSEERVLESVNLSSGTCGGSYKQRGEFARGNDPRGFMAVEGQQPALVARDEVIVGLSARSSRQGGTRSHNPPNVFDYLFIGPPPLTTTVKILLTI